MPEGKDAPLAPLNEIGGYTTTSGPLRPPNADRNVFFVNTSHPRKPGLQEGAAKVGPSTREAIAEFKREAKFHLTARRAQPPNTEHVIPDVIDYGSAPLLDQHGNVSERSTIITERIGSGKTLEHSIKEKGGLGVPFTCIKALPVALTIDNVSRVGIIHRDIKPGNIFLDEKDNWRFSDFGAAVTNGHTPSDGIVIGTPGYMSPEHA